VPNIKAAEKWMRRTETRGARNLDVKTRLKTLYKKAASTGGDLVQSVESQFDKAARKGIIHPNKAARKKSRLAKAAAKVSAPASAVKKPARRKAAAPKTSRKKKAAK
jgi:small subunit ribosomal protein S20